MRNFVLYVPILLLLAVTGCGSGDSSDGAGGENGNGNGGGSGGGTMFPADISGTYTMQWSGGGTNATGAFTCSGTATLTLAQAGTVITATLVVQTETGDCEAWFNWTGSGTYASSTGAISMGTVIGANTVIFTGTASAGTDGTVSLSGQWTVINTASADVVVSGTWSAM